MMTHTIRALFIATLLCGALTAAALEVHSAKFGSDNRWADVTAAFREMRINDNLYFGWIDGNRMAGRDPAPGVAKKLVVTYKDNDGTEKTAELDERTFSGIAANTPVSQEFQLGSAWFGDNGNYLDVTEKMREIIASNREVSLDFPTLGIDGKDDPAPGREKSILIFYGIEGKLNCARYKERGKFKGSAITGAFAPIPEALGAVSPFRGMELDRAVWQWSVDIPGSISHETGEPSKAFLYIPERTAHVRGVVIGQYNMLERPIMEHPKFREYLQKLDYGCIWIAPSYFSGKPWNGNLDPRNPAHTEPLEAMFRKFAEITGYPELEQVPFVGLGHSAMADFPYQLAAWKPERTISGISFDGTSPGLFHDRTFGTNPTITPDDLKRMEGIPFLQRTGGYGPVGSDRPLIVRSKVPGIVLTEISDPDSTHFDINDAIIDYMGKYLMKADKARGVGTLPLKKVAVADGWYIDFWQGDNPPRVPAAPVGTFQPAKVGKWGPENNWVFDEEHAKFHEAHEALYRGKKRQEVGYVQEGKMLPRRGDHFQVHPAFRPGKDGLTFRLKGGFPDSLTDRNGKTVTGLVHGDDPENVRIYPSSGPVVRLDDETVAVRFDRFGFNRSNRSHSFSFNAIHPGDAVFRRSVLQSSMSVPAKNTRGIRQFITFPEIPDVKEGTKSITLHAVCNTGFPVEYFVVHGPAYLNNQELIFTEIPPNAKFPVEVKVTAWQYGCGSGAKPERQTARPVTRTFHIVK